MNEKNWKLIEWIMSAFQVGQESRIQGWIDQVPANPFVSVAFTAALTEVLSEKIAGQTSPTTSRLVEKYLLKLRGRGSRATVQQVENIAVELRELRQWETTHHISICSILFGSTFGATEESRRSLRLLTALIVKYIGDFGIGNPDRDAITHFITEWFGSLDMTRTIDNVVVAATGNDKESRRILREFLGILMTMGKIFAEPMPHNAVPHSGPGHIGAIVSSNGSIGVKIQEMFVDQLDEIIEALYTEVKPKQDRQLELIRWFAGNAAQLAQDATAMWAEIRSNPRYGIRSHGQDRITVAVEGLHLGIIEHDFLQLVCEDCTFPDVIARYWIKVGEHRMILELPLFADAMDIVAVCETRDVIQIVDALLYFVALDSYWRIVCKPAPRKREKKTPVDVVSGPTRPVPVRPFFRWLQPGQNASAQALAASRREMSGNLPPTGKTFVTRHLRGVATTEIPQDSEPLFSYSDDDLGYSHE